MAFMQTTTMFYQGNPFPAAFLALGLAVMLLVLLLIVAIYVYMSLAYSAIARKAKYKSPGIAWIPIVGPLLITSSIAKMPWWPILLIIAIPIPFVGMAAMIAVCVFSIIWLWKTYEKVGRPGWWALFNLIEPVGFVFLGIVAWGKK